MRNIEHEVKFVDVADFYGLAERVNGSRDEVARVTRWSKMLLQHSRKTFGALGTPALHDRLAALRENHPNFGEAIDWLEAELAFAKCAGHGLDFQRLLLVGPAGTGKTTFCLELADALGLPAEVMSMNQAQTSAALTGSEQYWANSNPGALFSLLARSRVINPIMVLDEIEKAPRDGRYDPLAGLYTVLERRTAAQFADASLPQIRMNAAHVNWIATANSTQSLDAPVRSRFNIFKIRCLRDDEMAALVRRMYEKLLRDNPDVRPHIDSRLPEDVVKRLVCALESGRDIDRTLRRMVGQALKASAHLSVELLEEFTAPVADDRVWIL